MNRITRVAKFTTLNVSQVRSEDDVVESFGFRGHSAVFNQPTLIGTARFGFVETIAPGAFRDVLTDDVRFLINHDGLPLARVGNGTLRLSEDATGQVVDADLAPTREAEDLSILLERKDIDQMSFAFGLSEDDFTWGTFESNDELNGLDLRTINHVSNQYDVSTVTYPAYEGTDAGLRSLNVSDDEIRQALQAIQSEKETEEQLNDARFDRAKTITRARALHIQYPIQLTRKEGAQT